MTEDRRFPSRHPRKYAGVALALTFPFLLDACSADNDTFRAASVIYDYVSGSGSKITREQAAAIPYATMSVALGSGPEGLLVLGAAVGGELDWYGGEQISVATRKGIVIRTLGLPFDLGGIHAQPASGSDGTLKFLLDYPDLGIYSASEECRRVDMGDDSTEILGTQISTRHIVEHCVVASMDWRFDNEFWIDPKTNYIWRSSQYIHPKSPPLVLTILRPEQIAPG